MSKQKKDLLLAAIILAVAAAGFSVNYMVHRQPAAQLEIAINGEVVKRLDLSRNTELTIEGANGGSNHLVLQDGIAWIDEATCPDKVCIHQGKIRYNGQIIVCLPNQMTARIVGSGN